MQTNSTSQHTSAMHSQIIWRLATRVSDSASMRAIMRMPSAVSMNTHAMIDWFAYGWNRAMSAHVMMNMAAVAIIIMSTLLGRPPSMRANIWKNPSAAITMATRICSR